MRGGRFCSILHTIVCTFERFRERASRVFNSDAFRWYSLQCHTGVDSSITSSTRPMIGRRSVLSALFTFPCERMHAREIAGTNSCFFKVCFIAWNDSESFERAFGIRCSRLSLFYSSACLLRSLQLPQSASLAGCVGHVRFSYV